MRSSIDTAPHNVTTTIPLHRDGKVRAIAVSTERRSAALPEDAVDRDNLLTNVSIYWFTNTGGSSAGFYYEGAHAQLDWTTPSQAPQGWAVFNTDPIMKRLMNADNSITHFSEFTHGGHFPAMEEPDLLVADIREFFRSLR